MPQNRQEKITQKEPRCHLHVVSSDKIWNVRIERSNAGSSLLETSWNVVSFSGLRGVTEVNNTFILTLQHLCET